MQPTETYYSKFEAVYCIRDHIIRTAFCARIKYTFRQRFSLVSYSARFLYRMQFVCCSLRQVFDSDFGCICCKATH